MLPQWFSIYNLTPNYSQLDSSEKDRIESVKQAERDKVSQEMDEWQSLDDDEKEKRYLKSINKGDIVSHNQGMFYHLKI